MNKSPKTLPFESVDKVLGPVLAREDPRFLRRMAKAINSECGINGFYSSFGVTPEMDCGSRKFIGHVKVIRGRLMAREVCGDAKPGNPYNIDLTGITSVEGNGNGTVTASRYLKFRE